MPAENPIINSDKPSEDQDLNIAAKAFKEHYFKEVLTPQAYKDFKLSTTDGAIRKIYPRSSTGNFALHIYKTTDHEILQDPESMNWVALDCEFNLKSDGTLDYWVTDTGRPLVNEEPEAVIGDHLVTHTITLDDINWLMLLATYGVMPDTAT